MCNEAIIEESLMFLMAKYHLFFFVCTSTGQTLTLILKFGTARGVHIVIHYRKFMTVLYHWYIYELII